MPEWSPQVGHKFLLGQLWELGGSQCEPAIASIPFGAGLRLRRRPLYADQPPPGSPITSVAARPSSSFHPSSSPTPLHSLVCVDLSKRWHPPFNTSPFSNASFVLHISPYAFLYINNNFSELASQQHEVIFIFNQLGFDSHKFQDKNLACVCHGYPCTEKIKFAPQIRYR